MELSLCPACKAQALIFSSSIQEIPYFGKIMIFTFKCSNCNFKHNDIFNLEIKEPISYRVEVKNEKDLSIKVIRSSSCTIIIPELGVKIEPGVYSQGFITNAEGVLEKVENVLLGQLKFLKGKRLKKAKELIKKIEKMRNGKESFTLILKDPFGNSAIVSNKAKKRKLSERELKNLKKGMVIFELIKK